MKTKFPKRNLQAVAVAQGGGKGWDPSSCNRDALECGRCAGREGVNGWKLRIEEEKV